MAIAASPAMSVAFALTIALAVGIGVSLGLLGGGGSILAVPLLAFGLGRIDPAAKAAPWTFRALVAPGVVALWPFLLLRWLRARAVR